MRVLISLARGVAAAATLMLLSSLATAQEVRIVRQDLRSLDLVVVTGAPHLGASPAQQGRVVPGIPGAAFLEEEGLPGIPYARALIGVPSGHKPVLTILEAPERRISGAPLAVHVVPPFGLTEEDGWEEPVSPPLPRGRYPRRQAEIAWVGWLRDAQAAEVRFYPVRSAGAGGGVLHSGRIAARVTFEPDEAVSKPEAASSRRPAARGGSRAFRDLQRRALLNADQILAEVAGVSEGTAVEGFDAGPVTPSADSGVGVLSGPAPLKISVKSDGLYRVDPNHLAAAGVDPNSVDPRDFRMEHLGLPIPIEVLGESDGQFNAGDSVVFFGRAATTPWTHTNVYWLHFDGSPSRVALRDGTYGAPAPTPASFLTTTHFEQDLVYTQNPPGGAIDHWWAKLQSLNDPNSGNVTYTVSAPNLDPAPHTATVRVNLQGRTTLGANPDHRTRVFLNNTQIDDVTWDGAVPFTITTSVASSLLVSGNNAVRLQVISQSGVSVDQFYTNYIEIDYRRTYAATSSAVVADGEGAGAFRFAMTGFATNDVMVYDATDPNGLVRIAVPPAQITGAGPYDAGFQDTIASDRIYAAATPAGLKIPAAVVQDTPSALMSPANQADWIVVAPADYMPALQPLVSLRASQGYSVLTAITDDIYDEFSYGLFDPTAIKAFLAYAYTSFAAPAPEFVLMAGDGHIDYKDGLGSGMRQWVPPLLVNISGFGESPSDNEYVAVAGPDVLPEMFIGRLPARTTQDVTDIVNKILAYENTPPVAELNAQSLFVADDEDVTFEAVLGSLASLLPPTMAETRIYHSQIPNPLDVRSQIRMNMDAGALTTTFMGHGSATQWDDDCTWATSNVSPCFRHDPNTLLPTNRPTFIAALNCINGYWIDLVPAGTGHINLSLAEHMVRKDNRGAIAAWAPAALGTISDYTSIGDWLFREIFLNRQRVVGRAVVAAVIAAVTQPFSPAGLQNVQELTLFGDPATNLALDSDGDDLTDLAEETAGLDPLDADSDDDGVTDGSEGSYALDQDGDGTMNGLDPDADDDGVFDGTEAGVAVAPTGTDTGQGFFVADADPSTTTDPLDPDTDGGGVADGAEDRNFNGAVDGAETAPSAGNAADDMTCGSALPELANLRVTVSAGTDLALQWNDVFATHPCTLYRVYVSNAPKAPSTFAPWSLLALTSGPGYTHAGAHTDGLNHQYLVVAFDPVNGEGTLGHYGQ